MKDIDNKISHILTALGNEEMQNLTDIYKVGFEEVPSEESMRIEIIQNEMEKRDLVEVLNKNYNNCVITANGLRILAGHGTWTKYLVNQKKNTRNEKLLKTIIGAGNVLFAAINVIILIYSVLQAGKIDDKVESLRTEIEQVKEASRNTASQTYLLENNLKVLQKVILENSSEKIKK